MRLACDSCGKVYVADDRLAGRSFRMRCKRCGNVFTVEPRGEGEPGLASPGADGQPVEEAPAFTFGDTGDARPPGDPGAPAERGRPGEAGGGGPEGRVPGQAGAEAEDQDTAFADFSKELQDFCEELERDGATPPPGVERAAEPGSHGEQPAPAPGVPDRPADEAGPPAAPAASARRPSRSLAPAIALAVIAAGAGAWWLARSPGGTGAPERSVAGDAPTASPPTSAPPASAPVTASPVAPPAPAPVASQVPVPPPAGTAAATGEGAAQAAEAPPAVAPGAAPPPRERASSQPPRATRPPAPPAPKAAPPTSPAVAVPAVAAPPPPAGSAPSSPSRTDLPPRDPRAVQAQLAGLSGAFDECVAEARRSQPDLLRGSRTVVLTLTVRPSGRTAYPTLDDAQLSGTPLGACIKGKAAGLVFPESGGEPVRVRLQLELAQ